MFMKYWQMVIITLNREPLMIVYTTALILLTIIWLIKNRSTKNLLSVFLIALVFSLVWGSILTIIQYKEWQTHPISQKLLPPFQNINYFLQYSIFHFFRDFWFRLLGVLLTFSFLYLINFILKRDPFYDEEKLLIPLLTFLFPFPYNAFFLLVGFVILLFYMFFLLLMKRISLKERRSAYGLWLVLAWIFVLLQPIFYQNSQFILTKP